MIIDIEKLDQLKLNADKIFISSEGEEVLVQLLEIQKQVELAIDAAEAKLEETALKIDPNFSSIQADRIKVYYRAYGSKYKIDETMIAEVPQGLYKTVTKYNADSKAIEQWADEHKGLPVGIIEAERTKSLKFSLKDNE